MPDMTPKQALSDALRSLSQGLRFERLLTFVALLPGSIASMRAVHTRNARGLSDLERLSYE